MQEAGNLEDPNWRVPDQRTMDQQYMGGGFTFAIPNAEFLDFSGPGGSALEASKPCPFLVNIGHCTYPRHRPIELHLGLNVQII